MALLVRRRKLHAVAFAEMALTLAVHGHSLQPVWIICEVLAVLAFDGEQITLAARPLHHGVFTGADTDGAAAFGVAHHIAGLILRGPGAIHPGHVLPRRQHR